MAEYIEISSTELDEAIEWFKERIPAIDRDFCLSNPTGKSATEIYNLLNYCEKLERMYTLAVAGLTFMRNNAKRYYNG